MERKLISFSREVYDRLIQEPRGTQSALIDALLATHYGIQLSGDDKHALMRSQIQESLKTAPEFAGQAESLLDVLDNPENDVLADDVATFDQVADDVPTTEPAIIPSEEEPIIEEVTPEPEAGSDITVNVLGRPDGVPPVAPMDHDVCPKCGNVKLLPNCLNCDY